MRIRDKSILYSRVGISILAYSAFNGYNNLYIEALAKGISILAYSAFNGYNNLYIEALAKGMGLFGGLFLVTSTSLIFHIFIFLITGIILLLTGFFPRKVSLGQYSTLRPNSLVLYRFIFNNTRENINISLRGGEQFKIIEYPLIILFIIRGAIFLLSSSDLVSIFLSIELQSYGLYLLSTIYRDSEQATNGGVQPAGPQAAQAGPVSAGSGPQPLGIANSTTVELDIEGVQPAGPQAAQAGPVSAGSGPQPLGIANSTTVDLDIEGVVNGTRIVVNQVIIIQNPTTNNPIPPQGSRCPFSRPPNAGPGYTVPSPPPVSQPPQSSQAPDTTAGVPGNNTSSASLLPLVFKPCKLITFRSHLTSIIRLLGRIIPFITNIIRFLCLPIWSIISFIILLSAVFTPFSDLLNYLGSIMPNISIPYLDLFIYLESIMPEYMHDVVLTIIPIIKAYRLVKRLKSILDILIKVYKYITDLLADNWNIIYIILFGLIVLLLSILLY